MATPETFAPAVVLETLSVFCEDSAHAERALKRLGGLNTRSSIYHHRPTAGAVEAAIRLTSSAALAEAEADAAKEADAAAAREQARAVVRAHALSLHWVVTTRDGVCALTGKAVPAGFGFAAPRRSGSWIVYSVTALREMVEAGNPLPTIAWGTLQGDRFDYRPDLGDSSPGVCDGVRGYEYCG